MAERTRLLVEKHWMLFVDGENFTKRGQAVLKVAKVKPVGPDAWREDVLLWLPNHTATQPFIAFWNGPRFSSTSSPAPQGPQAHAADRAYYYTSMPYENEGVVTDTRLALRELGFEPRMFPRRQGKSKAVDLALATDVLTLAGEGRYEVAVIFAGDGDYVPVVEAVKRLGRHVVVGFFAGEGLSPELRIAADEFVDLTQDLIGAWTTARDEREREEALAADAAATAEPESG